MNNTTSNLTTENIGDDIMATNQPLPPERPMAPPDEDMMGWLTQLLVYSIFGSLVCFGNAVTFLAIRKSSRLNSKADFYISSLAVADFMVGVTFLVTSLTGIRSIGKVFRENQYVCLTYLNFIVVALTASVLTLVCLSFDRCVCVLNPLKYAKRQKRRTDLLLIALVWIVSIAYAAIPYIKPVPFVTGAVCIATIQHPKWYISYGHPLMGTTCFIAVAICYITIARKHFSQARKWGKGNVLESTKTHICGPNQADCKSGTDNKFTGLVEIIEKADSRPTDASYNGRRDKAEGINRKGDCGDDDLQEEGKASSSSDSGNWNSDSTNQTQTENTTRVAHNEPGNPTSNRRNVQSEVHGPMHDNVDCHSHTPAESGNGKSDLNKDNAQQSIGVNRPLSKQSVRLVKMTFIILVVFFFCWSPGNIVIIVSAYTHIDSSIQMMFLVLTFLNSGLNVVIYVTMNRRYREAILAILCLCNPFCNGKKPRNQL